MITARLLVAIVAVPLALVYAGGLIVVAIAGSYFHRARLYDRARLNRVSPIAVLLTCALLWPWMVARAVRGGRHG